MSRPKTKSKGPKVVPLYEAGLRVFGKGEHCRNPPKRTGVFPVWARDGGFRGWVVVTIEHKQFVYNFNGVRDTDPKKVHAGWWWSHALPVLPAAPPVWTPPTEDPHE